MYILTRCSLVAASSAGMGVVNDMHLSWAADVGRYMTEIESFVGKAPSLRIVMSIIPAYTSWMPGSSS